MTRAEEHYSDNECADLFAAFFPNGFAGKDVLQEIAPKGWRQSDLRFVFHPTLDQVHKEAIQLHRNIESFPPRNSHRPPRPEPTLEETAARYRDAPMDIQTEAAELVGMCLWDVFSDAHDVIAFDGRIVHIGSFRGAAGFIADQLNWQTHRRQYDYLDFYMGTVWVSQRANLTPVYEMIFRRLKDRLFKWRYRFPKIRLLRFHKPGAEENLKIAKLEAELEEAYKKDIENAKQDPPPATVLAYRNVYGSLPCGWPPWKSEDREE